jgi:hypothetical protein
MVSIYSNKVLAAWSEVRIIGDILRRVAPKPISCFTIGISIPITIRNHKQVIISILAGIGLMINIHRKELGIGCERPNPAKQILSTCENL